MAGLVDQLPALIGVAVGAFGTVLATAVSDRARWGHDREVRWEQRRLDANSTYAAALKEIYNLSRRITSPTDPLDRDAAPSLLAAAEVRRAEEWEAVLLVGDTQTVKAAREWREAIRRVEESALSGDRDDPEWAPQVNEANLAGDRFFLAARSSLSLPTSGVAQADWLSLPRERRI